ncbi:Rrf2 family transcriptional regulator, partial [Marinobacter sp. AC-23]|uniref:RrF2 family transcriptional regulator n=1 Tax=Marinobacter sp. AC-23 TaxID=1879031 RepID=UPI000A63AD5F
LKLRMATEDINVGVLVRETEHDLSVVECFTSKNACKITPVCGLKPMFGEALQAFLSVLDKYTLKDVMRDEYKPQLLRLLQIA